MDIAVIIASILALLSPLLGGGNAIPVLPALSSQVADFDDDWDDRWDDDDDWDDRWDD
ncbi:hypothetical protein COCCU_04310 [Corynebacterium occultum]|uniref:Uncharacterized protein n=1 Tax=Corynebacterium occultum TaxID=2675219 RepID=A0A6B8W9Y6_9CORY|nr:hypothetical protein [Corynebacterium occultum]QGU06810.1 hypothetical protein COCCU_04310 [Corynebacterium occultum]